jgi:nicotinic acid mononucleotide adenylyltransferase
MEVWDLDSGEGSTGFTADLLRRINSIFPGTNFHFVIGADNLAICKSGMIMNG